MVMGVILSMQVVRSWLWSSTWVVMLLMQVVGRSWGCCGGCCIIDAGGGLSTWVVVGSSWLVIKSPVLGLQKD